MLRRSLKRARPLDFDVPTGKRRRCNNLGQYDDISQLTSDQNSVKNIHGAGQFANATEELDMSNIHKRQLEDIKKDSKLSTHDPVNQRKQTPLFTFDMVKRICGDLVRKREIELKEYYENLLTRKMAEHYDVFIKFQNDTMKGDYEDTLSYWG